MNYVELSPEDAKYIEEQNRRYEQMGWFLDSLTHGNRDILDIFMDIIDAQIPKVKVINALKKELIEHENPETQTEAGK